MAMSSLTCIPGITVILFQSIYADMQIMLILIKDHI